MESEHEDGAPLDASQGMDPFTYRSKALIWRRREIFKMIVLTVLGVPLLRMVLIALLCSLCLLWIFLITMGLDRNRSHQQWPAWRRRWLEAGTRTFARAALFACGFYRVHSIGKADPKARVYVANHLCIVDGALLQLHRLGSMVAKHDTADLPLIGTWLKATDAIFVDRQRADARATVRRQIHERVLDKDSPPIFMFPEGTTTNGSCLLKFKSGAFHAGAPVQPVLIRYPFSSFDLAITNDGPSMCGSLVRMLCQIYNSATIEFLPVRYASPEEKADPNRYAEAVRDEMAEKLGVPTSPLAVEDALMWYWAHCLPKSKVQVNIAVHEMKQRFASRCPSLHDMRKVLNKFHAIDSDRDGFLSKDEFCDAILFHEGHPVNGEAQELSERRQYASSLFAAFDRNRSGKIDFREFMWGLWTLRDSSDASDKAANDRIDLACQIYDLDKLKQVDEKSMRTVLRQAKPDLDHSTIDRIVQQAASLDGGRLQRGVSLRSLAAIISKTPEFLDILPRALRRMSVDASKN